MPPPNQPKRPQDPRLWDMWTRRQRVYERSRFESEVIGGLFHVTFFVLALPFRIVLNVWRKQRRDAQWRRLVYGPQHDDANKDD